MQKTARQFSGYERWFGLGDEGESSALTVGLSDNLVVFEVLTIHSKCYHNDLVQILVVFLVVFLELGIKHPYYKNIAASLMFNRPVGKIIAM